MRLFLAINLPPRVQAAVSAALAGIHEAFASAVRWSAPDVIHLTVKFLGEQPDDIVDRLHERVRARASAHPRFDARLLGGGAFPPTGQPRVLWCGVEANPLLHSLYQDVERAAADVGVAAEERPFRPHVTVGRVRRPSSAESRRLAEALRGVNVDETFLVESIDLMRSQLSTEGARYQRLWSVPLADVPSHAAAGAR
jgi:2'-5' RNA ligase